MHVFVTDKHWTKVQMMFSAFKCCQIWLSASWISNFMKMQSSAVIKLWRLMVHFRKQCLERPRLWSGWRDLKKGLRCWNYCRIRRKVKMKSKTYHSFSANWMENTSNSWGTTLLSCQNKFWWIMLQTLKSRKQEKIKKDCLRQLISKLEMYLSLKNQFWHTTRVKKRNKLCLKLVKTFTNLEVQMLSN